MDCKVDEFLIQEYLEGSLDRLERIVMDEHIKTCKKCRRELTEMKLLLYELDAITEVDVPKEASEIRDRVVSEFSYSQSDSRFSIGKLMKIQKDILKRTNTYLDFVPGTKYLKKGIKKAPSLLYKAMGAALSGGAKLMMERARV